MNPNIYDYATTEYAQDAFIAWMCDNFHSTNPNKKYLAERFIELLFQTGKVPSYTDLKVDTQPSNIDVLVTLLDNKKNPIHYLIIEDKKFSQEHSGQLSKYIKALLGNKKTGITIRDISVAYYKTGHISSINSQFEFQNGICKNITVLSEANRIKNVYVTHPGLASFKICSLDDIHTFLSSHKAYIQSSGSEILIDYADSINRLWGIYNSTTIDIKNNPKSIQWGRVFEDFVINYGSKYPNLTFDIGIFNGHYWEIRFTQIVNGQCIYPVVNFRANAFDEKQPSVKFINGAGVLDNLHHTHIVPIPNKPALGYKRYKMPLGHFMNNASLNKITTTTSSITVRDLKTLLDEICKEYCSILAMPNPDFDKYIL